MICMYRHFSLFLTCFYTFRALKMIKKSILTLRKHIHIHILCIRRLGRHTKYIHMFLFLIRITRRVDLAMCVCIV